MTWNHIIIHIQFLVKLNGFWFQKTRTSKKTSLLPHYYIFMQTHVISRKKCKSMEGKTKQMHGSYNSKHDDICWKLCPSNSIKSNKKNMKPDKCPKQLYCLCSAGNESRGGWNLQPQAPFVRASIFAPRSSSSSMILTCPPWAARWSGVAPGDFGPHAGALTSIPSSRRRRT
jgi:hypothetical protein